MAAGNEVIAPEGALTWSGQMAVMGTVPLNDVHYFADEARHCRIACCPDCNWAHPLLCMRQGVPVMRSVSFAQSLLHRLLQTQCSEYFGLKTSFPWADHASY